MEDGPTLNGSGVLLPFLLNGIVRLEGGDNQRLMKGNRKQGKVQFDKIEEVTPVV